MSDEPKPAASTITLHDIQALMDKLAKEPIKPHRHIVNPRGGYCMCGRYVSAYRAAVHESDETRER